MRDRRLALVSGAAATLLMLCACATPPAAIPGIEKLFPSHPPAPEISPSDQMVDFNLDGTLSMRGFAQPAGGKFAQLLQDLDLALSSHWARDHIHYHRFGSIIEDVRQQPFYVPASQENFYQSNKDYVATRIDTVFRKSKAGQLTIAVTDLFQQDLDIAAIQESLTSAHFPIGASLGIWQWEMPFSGPIYDFDFKTSGGHAYAGQRPLYLLALGPAKSLELLEHAISTAVTVGKPHVLFLSSELALNVAPNYQNWLTIARTQNLGLVRRLPEYAVYRASNGCRSAGFTANTQLAPVAGGPVPGFAPHSGSYRADLFSVSLNGTPATHLLTSPAVDASSPPRLTLEIDCASLGASALTLLRVERVGTAEDIVLPKWVKESSANSMDLTAAFQSHQSTWGDKTLNLAPLVRGLAERSVDGTVIASAYFYFVKN